MKEKPKNLKSIFLRILSNYKVQLRSVSHLNRLSQVRRLFVLIILVWIAGTNLLYLTEKLFAKSPGPFSNYFESYWHIIIILFSGIEDKEPVSLFGMIEVTVLLILGVCLIALITGLIVAILVRKIQNAQYLRQKPPNTKLKDHVVIIGENRHLENIVRHVNLALGGREFILVVSASAGKLKYRNVHIFKKVFAVSGDPLKVDVLDNADLGTARGIIVLSPWKKDRLRDRDNAALMSAIAAYCRAPESPMIVELQKEKSLGYASPLEGVEFLISWKFGELLIGEAALNPGITEIFNEFMEYSPMTSEFYTVPVPKKFIGRSFSSVQMHFLDNDDYPSVAVGIDRSPKGKPNASFWLVPQSGSSNLPDGGLVLVKGDRLILISRNNLVEEKDTELSIFSIKKKYFDDLGAGEDFFG